MQKKYDYDNDDQNDDIVDPQEQMKQLEQKQKEIEQQKKDLEKSLQKDSTTYQYKPAAAVEVDAELKETELKQTEKEKKSVAETTAATPSLFSKRFSM
jgi:DNA repair exonuclease SbcCD ATPase subunit